MDFYFYKINIILFCFSCFSNLFFFTFSSDLPSVVWVEKTGKWTKLKGFVDWRDEYFELLNSSFSSSFPLFSPVSSIFLKSSSSSFNQSFLFHPKPWKYVYTKPTLTKESWKVYFNKKSNTIYKQSSNQSQLIFKFSANESFSWNKNQPIKTLNFTNYNIEINSLAVDWLTENFYIIDELSNNLFLFNRDILNFVILGNHLSSPSPSSLVLDSIKNLMCWIEEEKKIICANLMGKLKTLIFISNYKVIDLKIWRENDSSVYLIWIENNFIIIYNFISNKTEILYENPNNYNNNNNNNDNNDDVISYKGLAIFENYVFAGSSETLTIDAINIKTKNILKVEIDANPYFLTSDPLHGNQNKDLIHECNTLNCEQLCINQGHLQGHCACQEGYILKLDNKTCQEIKFSLFYSTSENILRTHPLSEKNDTQKNYFIIKSVHSSSSLTSSDSSPFFFEPPSFSLLSFDIKSNSVFFVDETTGSINRIILKENNNYNNTNNKMYKKIDEINTNNVKITAIAVDWYNSLILWMDSGINNDNTNNNNNNNNNDDKNNGIIMMSRFDGSYRVILRERVREGQGLAIDPYDSIIYWSEVVGNQRNLCYMKIYKNDNINNNNNINKQNYDENYKKCFMIVDDNLSKIVLDIREKRLFWSTKKENKIVCLHLPTNKIKEFSLDESSANYKGFTIFKDLLIVINNNIHLNKTTIFNDKYYKKEPLSFYQLEFTNINNEILYSKINITHLDDNIQETTNQTLTPQLKNYFFLSEVFLKSSQSRDVILFSRYLQPEDYKSNCNHDNNCDHLCISSPQKNNKNEFRGKNFCLCAVGYKKSDNKCFSHSIKKPSILIMDKMLKQVFFIDKENIFTKKYDIFNQDSTIIQNSNNNNDKYELSKSSLFFSSTQLLSSLPSPPSFVSLKSPNHPHLDNIKSFCYGHSNEIFYFLSKKHNNIISYNIKLNKIFNIVNNSKDIIEKDNTNDELLFEKLICLNQLNSLLVLTSVTSSSQFSSFPLKTFLKINLSGKIKLTKFLSSSEKNLNIYYSECLSYLFVFKPGFIYILKPPFDSINHTINQPSSNRSSLNFIPLPSSLKINSFSETDGMSCVDICTNFHNNQSYYLYFADHTQGIIYFSDIYNFVCDEYKTEHFNSSENIDSFKNEKKNITKNLKILYDSKGQYKISLISVFNNFLFFSTSNKRSVFKLDLNRSQNVYGSRVSAEAITAPIFDNILHLRLVPENPENQILDSSSVPFFIPILIAFFFLLLLLLIIICIILICWFRKKKKKKTNKSQRATTTIITSESFSSSSNQQTNMNFPTANPTTETSIQNEENFDEFLKDNVLIEYMYSSNETDVSNNLDINNNENGDIKTTPSLEKDLNFPDFIKKDRHLNEMLVSNETLVISDLSLLSHSSPPLSSLSRNLLEETKENNCSIGSEVNDKSIYPSLSFQSSSNQERKKNKKTQSPSLHSSIEKNIKIPELTLSPWKLYKSPKPVTHSRSAPVKFTLGKKNRRIESTGSIKKIDKTIIDNYKIPNKLIDIIHEAPHEEGKFCDEDIFY